MHQHHLTRQQVIEDLIVHTISRSRIASLVSHQLYEELDILLTQDRVTKL